MWEKASAFAVGSRAPFTRAVRFGMERRGGAPCPTWQLRNRQTQNGNSMMPTPNGLISRTISKAILEGDAGSHRACFDSCLIVAGVSNGLDSVIRGRIPLMTNHHRSLVLHCFTASAKGQIYPLTGLSSSGTLAAAGTPLSDVAFKPAYVLEIHGRRRGQKEYQQPNEDEIFNTQPLILWPNLFLPII